MKNRVSILGCVGLCISLFMVGCQSSTPKQTQVTSQEQQVVEAATPDNELGEQAYKKHCAACHQRNGQGVPGMYPPLANNALVSSDKARFITIVLHGLSGEIEVNGQTYNGNMAGYSNLSDEELAVLLSYIRSEKFGNTAEAVTVDEIKAKR